LDNCIRFRWRALPVDQREGIKGYIVNVIVKYSADEAVLSREKMYLGKLNLILVQILKQEWPHNWDGFVPQIVESGKGNEILCENNMHILKLLSEEIFDFSAEQMTSQKISQLKDSLTSQFSLIYQFCEFVLHNAKRPSLLKATLHCLLRYLSWVPLVFVFETKLIETLVMKFFMEPAYQNVALECLTEIGSTVAPDYHPQLFVMFASVVNHALKAFLQPNHEPPLRQIYHQSAQSAQDFIKGLSLFFTGFFKRHLDLVESDHGLAVTAMTYLVNISEVDDDEIFKICLEFWSLFADELYHKEIEFQSHPSPLLMSGGVPAAGVSPRLALYRDSKILSNVRRIMIDRMPKPEEVLVVVEDTGEVVRQHLPDVESVALHKTMRETLVFLTHLDFRDTEQIMIEKLNYQVGPNWNKQGLSTLCWAIGSISGAMKEDEEKHFLVTVIKELLGLCEITRGKDNKAVIASNIMYVVGQYPRFLKAHWKFLKTVIKKLFEFMHELHPGVQDMACETFLKISQRCRFKFVRAQQGEHEPFLQELLRELPTTISDLESHHIYMFYEAVGYMVGAEQDAAAREQLLQHLFLLPNENWKFIIAAARQNEEILKQQEHMREIAKMLTTNVRVASSLGHPYMSQLGIIYEEMLQVYRLYSELISATVAAQGEMVTKSSTIRAMRAVKRETLKLVETVVDKTEDVPRIVAHIVPPLMDPVLGDYQRNLPDTRDPEVLSLFAAIVNKTQGAITEAIPRIFESVFECTLMMITKNFQDFPEHRINFFKLLQAINHHCFRAFFVIPQSHFKLVIDSIVWAFKHSERNIAETGLTILLDLLRNVEQSGEVANQFYSTFFLSLIHDIFTVLTDTMHKTGFKLQAQILMMCMHRVEGGAITVPLYDAAATPGIANNQQFMRQHMLQLLTSAFPNVGQAQVQAFVLGMFDLQKDVQAFKVHLRDFLVQLKEFSGSDNSDLYLEEAELARAAASEAEKARLSAVPGLLPVAQRAEDLMGGP